MTKRTNLTTKERTRLRPNWIMRQCNYNISQFSDACQINRMRMMHLLGGISEPSASELRSIATEAMVSTDFLLGVIDNPRIYFWEMELLYPGDEAMAGRP